MTDIGLILDHRLIYARTDMLHKCAFLKASRACY